ncbi:acyltransferase [Shewanella sp. Shew256]|uniref:acyltransferase n=1 Tax=Shewanella sp. Shew256 TaxID=1969376 RepID=UPI000B49811C|nr:acyltransferase [Shewanella sp. Shew256]
MQTTLSLSQYVKKRNGVPLGANHSMRNMLSRALGAKSFPIFWHYWNPIWGYYLSSNVMRPLSQFLPIWLAVLLTFLVSGALHDLAVALVKWQAMFFFTPWFGIMGVIVIASNKYGLSYGALPWIMRALINLLFIFSSFALTEFMLSLWRP